MWRTTPMHRREVLESAAEEAHFPPSFPVDVSAEAVVGQESGYGPLFHRRYRTRIREGTVSGEDLISDVKSNLNKAGPTKLARFEKVLGEKDAMAVGDEYVVRMPGPWDGPVRVIAESSLSFRFATLRGHLEAGQIEFRTRQSGHNDDVLVFEIESWARSSDRLSNLLYHHLRMSKEVQLHMWISFLEGVTNLAGGRMTGGVEIDTWRIENAADGR
jgi:hypothetical protein